MYNRVMKIRKKPQPGPEHGAGGSRGHCPAANASAKYDGCEGSKPAQPHEAYLQQRTRWYLRNGAIISGSLAIA
jgi:hypothetical protein